MVERTLVFLFLLLHNRMVTPQTVSDKVPLPGNLTCYSCKLDFRKSDYEWNHPCLGRHKDLDVNESYLVACGPNDVYCRAERTEVNGVLIQLTRECTDRCYYGCRPKGFGINIESCAQCCNSNGCNNMYPKSDAGAVVSNRGAIFLLCLFTVLSSFWQ